MEMDLLSFQGGCPCCFPSIIIAVLLTPCIVCYVFEKAIKLMFPKFNLGIKALTFLTRLSSFLVLIVAVGLGLAASNPEWKSYVFYQFLTRMQMGGRDPFENFRCPHIGSLSGRVLEIGPGGGANFACWGSSSNTTHSIAEWVGVEPNAFFKEKLIEAAGNANVSFPTSTVWLDGENMDVAPESFDAVVGTHVLCSVNDIHQVLHQVKRALKPGGTYYFMEHVAAPPGTFIHYLQFVLEPFFNIIGNGCRFRETWRQLHTDASTGGGLAGFEVDLQKFDAPIKLVPLIPHIIGSARKLE